MSVRSSTEPSLPGQEAQPEFTWADAAVDITPVAATGQIQIYDNLTPRQNAYVYWRQQGLSPYQAAKRAGYHDARSAAHTNDNMPAIRELIGKLDEARRVRFEIDRDRVVEGIMEALSVAREQSDPKSMIQAWTEIARITGVQAPEVRRVEVTGEITQHHIARATDRELLQLVGRTRQLPEPTTIEGQVEVIEDGEAPRGEDTGDDGDDGVYEDDEEAGEGDDEEEGVVLPHVPDQGDIG